MNVVRIVVREPDTSTIGRLRSWFIRGGVEALLPQLANRPRIVAINDRDEAHVLVTIVGSDEAAEARRSAEECLAKDGIEAWARRYHVPPSFL